MVVEVDGWQCLFEFESAGDDDATQTKGKEEIFRKSALAVGPVNRNRTQDGRRDEEEKQQ